MLSEDQVGYLAIKVAENGILFFSLWIFLLAFILRLIFKDAGFEHLKIIASLIFVAYVYTISIETYKIDQIRQLTNQIISVKSSNLSDEEKKSYITDAQNNIEEVRRIEGRGLIFLLAQGAILGIFIILVRDTVWSWIYMKFFNRQPDK